MQLTRMLHVIERKSINTLTIGDSCAERNEDSCGGTFHFLSSSEQDEQIVFRANRRQYEGDKLMLTEAASRRIHRILLRSNPKTGSLKMRLNLYFGAHLSSLRVQLGLGTHEERESLWLAKCFFCLGYLMGVFPSPFACCKIETRTPEKAAMKSWQCLTLK